MFGISFWELLLIGLVALIVVGPDKLPQMLGTLGRWSNKLRRLTTEARQQTGIDDLLRQNGISGGLDEIRELRQIVRGNIAGLAGSAAARGGSAAARPASSSTPPRTTPATTSPQPSTSKTSDPYADIPSDPSREYPEEGCDAYGCLPDDLWVDPDKQALADEMLALHERAFLSKSPEQGSGEAPEEDPEPPPDGLLVDAEAPQIDAGSQPGDRPTVETQAENALSPPAEEKPAPGADESLSENDASEKLTSAGDPASPTSASTEPTAAPGAKDRNQTATAAAAQPPTPDADDPSRA